MADNDINEPEDNDPPLVTDPESGIKRKLTPDELDVFEGVAKTKGREWATKHLQLILNQAYAIGTIREVDQPKEQ